MTALSGENGMLQINWLLQKWLVKSWSLFITKNGFVLESLSKTSYDNQRIAKNISVSVAHKIGDADEFKHDTGVVYTESPFIISIFTKNSDYDTISKIAKDVYEVLK